MQGNIVEYVEHGKFICAAVITDTGSRLRLLNQNGREMNLPKARIVHHSPGAFLETTPRDHILQELQEVSSFRQSITLPVSLQDVWELASENEGQCFTPRFLTELCFGEQATNDHVAAFLRAIFQEKLFFKYRGEAIQAHPPEVVEQLKLKQEREQQQEEILN